ncbi:type II restriction endonuclease, TdeIII [Bellilinea caldifistulae]|uniref:type II site-specific deoxyribonuclease n=1 Tax=Bellilinea caldifistulae TaxID=360411 RepID=A0A0P6XU11_9CHLR|nr:TdeIII family type II restriction endonuclease [Bellilinea caldifistulae]KPL76811.1 restriction endonuclease TdeIII [Bellilinea caldifistulae]GAP09026.1 type II restriction endonuclease, TdeIII [Bellilinea caldifistulae]
MTFSATQQTKIEELLKQKIRRKLSNYSSESQESQSMPFHVRLLGKDRMALFSFIQSLNTTLGTSVFEQVAAIVASPNFRRVVNQYREFDNTVSENAQVVIQEIIDNLRAARETPDKAREIKKILDVAQTGTIKTIRRPRIDLFLESHDGTEYYFDLKTAKPNRDDIIGFKRKLLEWVAIRGSVNRDVKIFTGIGIPYNPYEPQPYDRWTFQGMFDLERELKVGKEFWDFLGGKGTYEALLEIFEKVGIELRPEIDQRFSAFTAQ